MRRKRYVGVSAEEAAAIAETAWRIIESLKVPGMPLDAVLSHFGIGDGVAEHRGWHVSISNHGEGETQAAISHAFPSGQSEKQRHPSARGWQKIREALVAKCGPLSRFWNGGDGSDSMSVVLAVTPPENLVEAIERYHIRPFRGWHPEDPEEATDPYRDGYLSWNRWWNSIYARKYGRPEGPTVREAEPEKRPRKKKKATTLAIGDPDLRMPVAGEYWRVADPAGADDTIQGLMRRSDSVFVSDPVFLVKDVYYVGDAPHSVHLAKHPQSGGGGITANIAWFVESFVFAEDGAAVRLGELAAVEKQIHSISEDMQREPSVETLKALSDDVLDLVADDDGEAATDDEDYAEDQQPALDDGRERSGPPALRAALPAAFARSAALLEAAHEAHDLSVRKAAWLAERATSVSLRTKWLAAFYEERAHVQLAQLAPQRRQIKELQQGIVSLDVYAGKDVDVEQLIEGAGAPASEPLHLMQRRLYMDEEYLVHLSTGGADWSDFDSFADLVATNRDFLDRILPFPRCVVAMRFRRRDKDYFGGEQVRSFFEAIGIAQVNAEKNKPNRDTFFLIRNGENVHRVFSDVGTDDAERLFPTGDEFDALFVDRWHRDEGRKLEFGDLDYFGASQKKNQLALRYRRVLILLWGLQARTEIFGRFYDPEEYSDVGFLDRRLQADRLVFVADDEGLLTEGRPSFREWIATRNAYLAPGSRVVAEWRGLVSRETAPELIGRHYPKGYVKDAISASVVHARGGSLCTDTNAVMEGGARRRIHVKLTGGGGRRGLHLLCLDDVAVEDLDYYLRSREARESYLEYWQLFAMARRELLREQERLEPIRQRLDRALVDVDAAKRTAAASAAIRLWRQKNEGAMPTSAAKTGESLRQIASEIARPTLSADEARELAAAEGREILRVTIDGASAIELEATAAENELPGFGLPHPWIVRRRVRRSGGRWQLFGAPAFIFWENFDPARHPLHVWPKTSTLGDEPFQGVVKNAHEASQITRTGLLRLAEEMRIAGERSRVLLGEGLPTFSLDDVLKEMGRGRSRLWPHVDFSTPLAIISSGEGGDVQVLWAQCNAFGALVRAMPSARADVAKYFDAYAAQPDIHMKAVGNARPELATSSIACSSKANGFGSPGGAISDVRFMKKAKKGLRFIDVPATVKEFLAGDATMDLGHRGSEYRVVTWLDVDARRLAGRILAKLKRDADD